MVKSKRVTLKDISRAVNVSLPTVSKVLNGKATFCSEAKLKEIKKPLPGSAIAATWGITS